MRTFDFSPYFRSGIGFDRVFDLLDSVSRLEWNSWPPYDIVKTGAERYQIAMAVPGFAEADLSVTHEGHHLVVRGQTPASRTDGEYLHRGIGEPSFERRFELADYIRVTDACLANGVLRIGLVREVPEDKKPRQIPIQSSMLPKWTARRQPAPANTDGRNEPRGWWQRLTGRAA